MLLLDVVHLAIAIVIGLVAVATSFYLSFFVTDLIVPITVDRHPPWHQPPGQSFLNPYLNNLLLLTAFGLHHSLLSRDAVKAVLAYIIPQRLYRLTFVMGACSILVLLFYCWQPIPNIVWEVRNPILFFFIQGLVILNSLLLVVALLWLDPLQLLGIRDPLDKVQKRAAGLPTLVTTGLYGLMRNPVYTFLILQFWISPKMTVGHLLLASVFTFYTVYATVYYEEPDLVKHIGPSYVKYMQTTPRFIPRLKTNTKKE